MANMKRTAASKFLSVDLDDFINESQYVKDSPKNKKSQKRNKTDTFVDDAMSKLGDNQAAVKRRKVEAVSCGNNTREKVLETMSQQIEARNKCSEVFLKRLSEVLNQLDADYAMMKENEQKLEQVTGALLKCIQQGNTAQKQNLKTAKEIHNAFKNESEEMSVQHKAESEKLAEELDKDLKNLEQKLKRSGWENLRKTMFHAMQNDL